LADLEKELQVPTLNRAISFNHFSICNQNERKKEEKEIQDEEDAWRSKLVLLSVPPVQIRENRIISYFNVACLVLGLGGWFGRRVETRHKLARTLA
jgi:hypothetical protein